MLSLLASMRVQKRLMPSGHFSALLSQNRSANFAAMGSMTMDSRAVSTMEVYRDVVMTPYSSADLDMMNANSPMTARLTAERNAVFPFSLATM